MSDYDDCVEDTGEESGAIMVLIVLVVALLFLPGIVAITTVRGAIVFIAAWILTVDILVHLTDLNLWLSLPIGLVLSYLAGIVATIFWLARPPIKSFMPTR